MNRVCENSPGLLGIVGPLARPPVARQANVTDNEFVENRVDVEENPGKRLTVWKSYKAVMASGLDGDLTTLAVEPIATAAASKIDIERAREANTVLVYHSPRGNVI